MKSIKTKISLLSEAEGGRHCMPVGTGYSPHLIVDGTREYLAVRFLNVPESVKEGDEIPIEIELLYPDQVDYSRLVESSRFVIMEGNRSVGSGVVVMGI